MTIATNARERIRASHIASGRRIVVLDDDPTGSQSVHGVTVVTSPDREAIAAALREPGSTCFVLTNTRSLPEAEAVALNRAIGRAVDELDVPVEVVSRSDSTLRGHVIAEVRALDAARREATGRGYDGVLLAPAYFEAGRCTSDDVHWARVGDRWLPVGETEFACDASFGYAASDLREFVAEKSRGAIAAGDVASIGIDDIRHGGPGRVAEILRGVTDGAWVVVNATDYEDLEIVVLGLFEAEADGRSFLYRTAPSFVRALTGQEPRDPLTAADIWPAGGPTGHGLVVVGSHVGLTSRQVAAARSRGKLATVELDVAAVADPAYVADAAERVRALLGRSHVLLLTSRTLARGADAGASLGIARAVSAAVVEVVRRARAARPAWVVAKGGITSHDVAVHGLGIRRAEVVGQLLPGMVSLLRPVDATPEAIGTPYVVFAGNVGGETALADVIALLGGGA